MVGYDKSKFQTVSCRLKNQVHKHALRVAAEVGAITRTGRPKRGEKKSGGHPSIPTMVRLIGEGKLLVVPASEELESGPSEADLLLGKLRLSLVEDLKGVPGKNLPPEILAWKRRWLGELSAAGVPGAKRKGGVR